jgi:hypothetical protein
VTGIHSAYHLMKRQFKERPNGLHWNAAVARSWPLALKLAARMGRCGSALTGCEGVKPFLKIEFGIK